MKLIHGGSVSDYCMAYYPFPINLVATMLLLECRGVLPWLNGRCQNVPVRG